MGANCIDVTPDFLDALDFARADYDAPAGKVEVSWRRTGEQIELQIVCPQDVQGDIVLPAGFAFQMPEEMYGRVHGAHTLPLRSGTFCVGAVRA